MRVFNKLISTVKVKWSRYRPGVAQRVGRGIALLFHDRGTRREWVVSSTPQPHFTPGKDPVPILQEARWAPGPVWTGGKSRPHRDSIPDRPARSQSLYRPSYPGKTQYPLYRRLDGPQGRSGRAENLVPTGIRSRTVQPVVSRYTDWATRPTEQLM